VHPTDDNYILTASKGFNGAGGEARVIDRRTAGFAHHFAGHEGDANGCAWLDAEHFATAGKDGTVRLWSTAQRRQLHVHQDADTGIYTCMGGGGGGAVWVGTHEGALKRFTADRSGGGGGGGALELVEELQGMPYDDDEL